MSTTQAIDSLVPSLQSPVCWAEQDEAVLVCTGGAAGLYRPSNPGNAAHRMWYSPFNTGAGLAMGIRAGAEMTSVAEPGLNACSVVLPEGQRTRTSFGGFDSG